MKWHLQSEVGLWDRFWPADIEEQVRDRQESVLYSPIHHQANLGFKELEHEAENWYESPVHVDTKYMEAGKGLI